MVRAGMMMHPPHKRNVRRRGYVLVMALVMITITALALVGIARRSLLLATAAVTAEEQLQQRWAETSLRQTVLEHAELALLDEPATKPDSAEEPVGENGELPRSTQQRSRLLEVDLAGKQYRVLLADENAKVNLNEAYRRGRRAAVQRTRRELSLAAPSLRERLRPYRTSAPTTLPAFDSWGQVFDFGARALSPEQQRKIVATTDQITCWGNGKLNVHQASDEALLTVASWVVNRRAAEQLVQARQQSPQGEIANWLADLSIREQEQRELLSLLSETSQTYSLWLEVHAERHPPRLSFSVYHGSRGTPRKIDTFQF